MPPCTHLNIHMIPETHTNFEKKSGPVAYMLNINKVIYFLTFILFTMELTHLSSSWSPRRKDIQTSFRENIKPQQWFEVWEDQFSASF